MKARLVVAGLLFVGSSGLLLGQRGGGASAAASLDNPQAIAEGEALYNETCVTCHGASGSGGSGPALTSGDRVDLGRSDTQTYNAIKNGLPGTPMKPLG